MNTSYEWDQDEFIHMLRRKMRAKHLDQRKLAKLTGISEVNISRYRRGERRPSCENLIKMANVLECSLDELVGRA